MVRYLTPHLVLRTCPRTPCSVGLLHWDWPGSMRTPSFSPPVFPFLPPCLCVLHLFPHHLSIVHYSHEEDNPC